LHNVVILYNLHRTVVDTNLFELWNSYLTCFAMVEAWHS